jgi:hypothetical protein
MLRLGRWVLIYDDGTPRCLPKWARDEIVDLRMEVYDLKARAREHQREFPRPRAKRVGG